MNRRPLDSRRILGAVRVQQKHPSRHPLLGGANGFDRETIISWLPMRQSQSRCELPDPGDGGGWLSALTSSEFGYWRPASPGAIDSRSLVLEHSGGASPPRESLWLGLLFSPLLQTYVVPI